MNNMIKYYEHPYLLASSLNNFQKDFYKKIEIIYSYILFV